MTPGRASNAVNARTNGERVGTVIRKAGLAKQPRRDPVSIGLRPIMKRLTLFLATMLSSLAAAQGPAGTPTAAPDASVGKPFRIERLDPALDAVVSANATLETLGDRFALTEGPVWVPQSPGGYLLFSDNAANVIYRWEEGKPLAVHLERSG